MRKALIAALLLLATTAGQAADYQLGAAQTAVRALKKPLTPTNLSTSILSDSSLRISWTQTAPNATTKVYRDGVEVCSVASGTSTCDDVGLTPATNYTYTAKHAYGAILSDATGGLTGRPKVVASGGTESEGGGFHYHVFTTDGTFTLSVSGHISYWGIGCGGDGGAGEDTSGATLGGGGGAGGNDFSAALTLEPPNAYPIVIGTRVNGGSTTYRTSTATKGDNGVAAVSVGGTAGDGGDNISFSGGAGLVAGTGNNGGGGGGAGAGGNGANGGLFGGAAGVGISTFPLVGTVGTGGNGGRVTGNGEAGANYGDGGSGHSGVGNPGGVGHAGVFVIRYPI